MRTQIDLPGAPGNDSEKPILLSSQMPMTRDVGAVLLGRRLLDKMLRKRRIGMSALSRKTVVTLLSRYGAGSLECLYEDIGTGRLPASAAVRDLLDILHREI